MIINILFPSKVTLFLYYKYYIFILSCIVKAAADLIQRIKYIKVSTIIIGPFRRPERSY